MIKSKKKMFRDFAHMPKKYVKHDGLKYGYHAVTHFKEKHGLSISQVFAMLFCYDLEFYTIKYLAKGMDLTEKFTSSMIIYPLMKKGYMYKYFDKLTPSQTAEDHIFRSETKMNYRVRYALTQKGRIMVTDFYRSASGSLPSKF